MPVVHVLLSLFVIQKTLGDFSQECYSPAPNFMALSVTLSRYVTLQRNTASHDVAVEQVTVENL